MASTSGRVGERGLGASSSPSALLVSTSTRRRQFSTRPAAPPLPVAAPAALAYGDLLAAAETFRNTRSSTLADPAPSSALVSAHLARFATSPSTRDAALALYVNASLFDTAAASFGALVADAVAGGGPTAACLVSLVSEGGRGASTAPAPFAAVDPLFPLFASHCLAAYARRIAAYRDVVQALDMRAPHTWHPLARSLTRKIIYHAGPTNSGKTHAALAALSAAPSGVYCGPLRLLAVEVWDELNARGVPTRLVTGQEARDVPGARHTACTVEMADVGYGAGTAGEAADAPASPTSPTPSSSSSARVAVAVIDEIQLIGDPGRGWAWTRALHGLAADEVHVCGDATAMGLVAAIAADCGDAFEVRTYRRFRPLRLDTAGLPNGLADVQPGDCVVAFSRADIYAARARLEAATGLRAAVIYGALPPETRRAQARLFNEPGGGADVLVASDAVGMGLNLNIRRVVFAGLTKPTGAIRGGGGVAAAAAAAVAAAASTSSHPLPAGLAPEEGARRGRGRPSRASRAPIPPPALKQIAGRAGRRSSPWPEGLATTLAPGDLPALAAALSVPTTTADTPAAALFPELDQLEAYAGRHPGAPLAEILARAAGEARLDGRYFFAQQTSVLEAAALLESVPGLSLRDRFLFCAAPASPRDKRSAGALVAFAAAYAAGGTVPLAGGGHAALLPGGGGGRGSGSVPAISTAAAMKDAEDAHSIVSLYMWLARRFSGEGRFPDLGLAGEEASRIIQLLDAGLEAVGAAGRARARSGAGSGSRSGQGRKKAEAEVAEAAAAAAPAAAAAGGGAAAAAAGGGAAGSAAPAAHADASVPWRRRPGSRTRREVGGGGGGPPADAAAAEERARDAEMTTAGRVRAKREAALAAAAAAAVAAGLAPDRAAIAARAAWRAARKASAAAEGRASGRGGGGGVVVLPSLPAGTAAEAAAASPA